MLDHGLHRSGAGMAKYYDANGVTTFQPTGMSGHRSAWLIDTVPAQLNQSGERLQLDRQGPGVEVVHAGNHSTVDFTQHTHIFTRGLFNCFAVCAVWNRNGQGIYQNGFLAHVSSPGPPNGQPPAYFQICVQNIPNNAYVACGVGNRLWGARIAATINQQGVPQNNIWIYYRPNNDNQVGFGVNKYGRFGEVF
jgi:hypothetical protein